MKLSIFTTITDPELRGDNSADALHCYSQLADELIIIDGSINNYGLDQEMIGELYTKQTDAGFIERMYYYPWPQEFSWDFIGQQFSRGYEACTGDWVIHCDLDFLFHERDFGRIRQALKEYPDAPAVSFYKWQFILPDRYNLKSRLLIAVNKKKFGDRITFSGGGDLCQPQLDGVDLDINEMPQAGVPFYNYEKLTKTELQINDDVERMDNAYLKYFGATLYSTDSMTAYEGWLRMVCGRFNKPQERIPLSAHPKYVQETIKNLRPDQFGYNAFGHLEDNDYVK